MAYWMRRHLPPVRRCGKWEQAIYSGHEWACLGSWRDYNAREISHLRRSLRAWGSV
ncbi:hypothetical protein P3T16_004527 [Paraburkholderia sp. GAS42]|jgi:hypothetical protein